MEFHNACDMVALDSFIALTMPGDVWMYNEEHPHIDSFVYTISRLVDPGDEPDEERLQLGEVTGYKISNQRMSETAIWDEADALDADAVCYVEALIRELRCCGEAFGGGPSFDLSDAQRVTIVGDLATKTSRDFARILKEVTANLAVMDAPQIMLVDLWSRHKEESATEMCRRARALGSIGFHKMVGSKYMWAENLLDVYNYRHLLEAKRTGKLSEILSGDIADEVYGQGTPLPVELKEQMGLPTATQFEEEIPSH